MIVYILVILGILACSASQLLLKSSAGAIHRSKFFELFNIRVITAYAILLGSLLVNIWAMSHGVQLKEIAMLESLGYIFVPILSLFVLGEHIGQRTLIAIALIISGIIVFNFK